MAKDCQRTEDVPVKGPNGDGSEEGRIEELEDQEGTIEFRALGVAGDDDRTVFGHHQVED